MHSLTSFPSSFKSTQLRSWVAKPFTTMSEFLQDSDLSRLCKALKKVTDPYSLGLYLGIPGSDLKRIEADHPSVRRRKQEVCSTFLRLNPNASWNIIVQALNEMGEKALASKIHKKYVGKQKPAIPSSKMCINDVSGSNSSSESGLGTSISESEAFNSPDFSLRDRCGCKPGCRMHQFCDVGCPKPDKHAVVPVLSESTSVATSLHHFHLEAQRKHETRQMTATFAGFVDETCKSIKKKVTVEEFALWLMQLQAFDQVSHSSESMPLLLAEQIDEICQAGSMERVFLILSNYWSWYNHGLLEEIINKFGDEKDRRRLDDFKESFSTFAQNRIVEFSQHPMTFGAAVGDGQTRVPLLFKVDRNWDTVHINELSEIHRSVASILGVNPHTLYLASIRKGCILMKFLIPSSVAQAVFPLSASQQEALATADIMLVKCGTHCHRFLPHSKHQNNVVDDSPQNDVVTTLMRTRYWSDVPTPPESALDSDCDEGPSGDLTSDDDAADSSSEQLSSEDNSSDSEEKGSEEVHQQIPRKIKMKTRAPVGGPRGILTTHVRTMLMFALVSLCLFPLAGLRECTPDLNHNWQSNRRGAGSDSLHMQCSKNGAIVQNPNFWVNVTDATLRSMPNVPILPASMRYADYSTNTVQYSPAAPPLIPTTPPPSQPTSTGGRYSKFVDENRVPAAPPLIQFVRFCGHGFADLKAPGYGKSIMAKAVASVKVWFGGSCKVKLLNRALSLNPPYKWSFGQVAGSNCITLRCKDRPTSSIVHDLSEVFLPQITTFKIIECNNADMDSVTHAVWTRNEVMVRNSSRITINKNGSITIAPARPEDEGGYRCGSDEESLGQTINLAFPPYAEKQSRQIFGHNFRIPNNIPSELTLMLGVEFIDDLCSAVASERISEAVQKTIQDCCSFNCADLEFGTPQLFCLADNRKGNFTVTLKAFEAKAVVKNFYRATQEEPIPIQSGGVNITIQCLSCISPEDSESNYMRYVIIGLVGVINVLNLLVLDLIFVMVLGKEKKLFTCCLCRRKREDPVNIVLEPVPPVPPVHTCIFVLDLHQTHQ